MEKHILENLVREGFSHRKIAQKLDISYNSVRYWLDKHELKTKPKTKRGNEYGKKQITYHCVICGCTDEKNFYKSCKGTWCKDCHNKICINKQRERKREFVDYKGKKCQLCGYDKCIGAMEFHHRDPNQKDPDWNNMKGRSLTNVKEELDKCDLLCSRCHREVHWDITTKIRGLVDP